MQGVGASCELLWVFFAFDYAIMFNLSPCTFPDTNILLLQFILLFIFSDVIIAVLQCLNE